MLFILTTIISYANKLPIINKIVNLLQFWYGKTSWWQILVKIRKAFILFNAALGLMLMFKITGLTSENILASFYLLGNNYMEAFFNLSRRIFNWFVDLFDHKIIPNVPGDSSGGILSKNNTPSNTIINKALENIKLDQLLNTDGPSLRKLYGGSIENTPWYKDWSILLWITGGIVTIGVLYFGYMVFIDPIFTHTSTPATGGPPINPGIPDTPDITLNDTFLGNLWNSATGGVIKTYRGITNTLNPFNYYVSASESQNQFNNFMEMQNDMNRSDRRFYPFTDVNPLDSKVTKLRKYFIGESTAEFFERTRARQYAERIYEGLRLTGKDSLVGGSTPIPWDRYRTLTPTIWGTGLQTPINTSLNIPSTISGLLETWNLPGEELIERKLSKIPQLPKTELGNPTPDLSNKWTNHAVDREELMKYFKTPPLSPNTSYVSDKETVGGI
jgi:hypothetical protein